MKHRAAHSLASQPRLAGMCWLRTGWHRNVGAPGLRTQSPRVSAWCTAQLVSLSRAEREARREDRPGSWGCRVQEVAVRGSQRGREKCIGELLARAQDIPVVPQLPAPG